MKYLAATMLALAASSTAQVLTSEVIALGNPFSGPTAFEHLSADDTGSWVVSAKSTPSASDHDVVFGVLGGAGSPSVLRTAQTLSGYPQARLRFPRVLGSDIAYTSTMSLGQSVSESSSWINDTPVARSGDVIGVTGLEWQLSTTPTLTHSGDYFISGLARPAASAQLGRQVIVRYPAEEVILEVGMTVPGVGGPIDSIYFFDASPSGAHWVALVVYDSTVTGQLETALVSDGAVYEMSPGAAVTSELAAFASGGIGFGFIDDEGQAVFSVDSGSGRSVFRGSTPALALGPSSLVDVDADGFALTQDFTALGNGVTVDGVSLDRIGVGGVDVDLDGTVDPGWTLVPLGPLTIVPSAAFLGDGSVLVTRAIDGPGVAGASAIIKATFASAGRAVCPGAVNASGEGASIRAIGSRVATFNDLQLRLIGLNNTSVVLPLYSRAAEFVANPGGSDGNLCLGGAIGRGVAVSGGSGFAVNDLTLSIYPASFPQPNGAAAAQPGETWFFQAWYRQPSPNGATSNFTGAVAVAFD